MYRLLAAVAMLISGAAIPGVAQGSDRHFVIDTEITVASEGEITEVLFQGAGLPAAIESAALASIRGMRFEPVRVDGRAASVTTPMSFSVCLSERQDRLQLALEPLSHGPRMVQPSPRFRLPRAVFNRIKGGSRLEMLLGIEVDASGSARLESLEVDRDLGGARRQLEADLGRWIQSLTFLTEQVDGQAVASRLEWPMWVSVSASAPRVRRSDAESSVCQRAREALEPLPRLLAGTELLRLTGK